MAQNPKKDGEYQDTCSKTPLLHYRQKKLQKKGAEGSNNNEETGLKTGFFNDIVALLASSPTLW